MSGAAHFTLEPDLSGLAQLLDWIQYWSESHKLEPRVLNILLMSAEELVVNVIHYGFEGLPRLPIEVSLALNADHIRFTLADQGKAFDPTQAPVPQKVDSLEDAPIGGWGVELVRQFSTTMAYHRDGSYNHLVVSFPIHA